MDRRVYTSIVQRLIDTIRRFGLEYWGRYYSVYRGECVDIVDANSGKISVKVPITGLDTTILEPALPIYSHAGQGYGHFWPPKPGDFVWVFFENGDPTVPIYVGGWWAKDELPDDFKSVDDAGVPQTRGWITPGGHKILLGDKSGEEYVEVSHSGGKRVRMTAEKVSVGIGDGPFEPVVLGNQLKQYIDTHIHPTSYGPSSPPQQPLPDTALSTSVETT